MFFLVFGFTACSPKYYTPDTHNVPLISQKGETNISLAGATNRVEFQASQGITKNIALKANGGIYVPETFNDDKEGSGKFMEVGAGYFKKFDDFWIFETYGIFGIGMLKNKFPFEQNPDLGATGRITASLTRIGIQPNFGFKNDIFMFAISSRFVHLSYQNIAGDLVFDGVDQLNYLRKNNAHFLIEPAVTFGAGIDNFGLRIQTGFSRNLTNENFRQKKSFTVFIFNYSF